MNTKSSNLQYAINADPSNKYLLKQFKKQEHLIFITYQGKIEGVIKEVHQYTIKLKDQEDDLNKHDILYFYKPESINAIDNIIQIDDEIAALKLEPELKKTERLRIDLDILKYCSKHKKEIKVYLRNGHILCGKIHSYGMFSIRLQFDKDSRAVILKPNIYDLVYENEENKIIHARDIEPPSKKAKKKKKASNIVPKVNDKIFESITPVAGKVEFILRISELPKDVRTVENNWKQFIVNTGDHKIRLTVRPKAWNKLTKAANNFPLWVAVISGKMEYNNGFELKEPNVQIFERKQKKDKE